MSKNGIVLNQSWQNKFVKESNAIESIFSTEGKYFDKHMRALRMAISFGKKKEPITEDNLLKLHRKLMYGVMPKNKETKRVFPAGKYRTVGVYVADDHCPDPDDISDLMDKILITSKDIKTKKDCWKIHDAFECVHPFIDGNGRIGRLLMVWMCLKISEQPPLIYSKDKHKYYGNIRKFRDNKSEEFFGKNIVRKIRKEFDKEAFIKEYLKSFDGAEELAYTLML